MPYFYLSKMLNAFTCKIFLHWYYYFYLSKEYLLNRFKCYAKVYISDSKNVPNKAKLTYILLWLLPDLMEL